MGQTTLKMKWTAATDNIAVVNYYVWQTVPTLELKATLNASTLAYEVTGLTADTDYKFRLKADDAAGNMSNYSNEITCKTLA